MRKSVKVVPHPVNTLLITIVGGEEAKAVPMGKKKTALSPLPSPPLGSCLRYDQPEAAAASWN